MSARSASPKGVWRDMSVGDVVTLQRGFDITKKEQSDGPYPVISSSGPTSTHSSYKVQSPGVIIGRKGLLGGVYFSKTPFWPHDTTLWVKDFHSNDPKFVYYWLRTLGLEKYDVGVANPTLNRNHVHLLSTAIPGVETQRKIASALSAYDDLIENNDRRILLLEDMARQIYREWFVEFRYPGHNDVPLIDSGLGPIPQGWSIDRVGDHATTVRGRSYRGVEVIDEGGVPFVNLKCIARDGGFRPDGVKRYLGQFKESQKVAADDIVMAVTDMTQERRIVARAARVPNLGGEFGVFSMDLVKIVPNGVPSEYLLGLLRYTEFPDKVKAYANGANVLHLHPDRIIEYKSAFPPPALANLYAEQVAPAQRLSDELQAANEKLRSARDLLLPRLISGEIDVSERDIAMPEVAS